MGKKNKFIRLGVSDGGSKHLCPVAKLEQCGSGYYLGELTIGSVPFHVEAVAVKVSTEKVIDDGKYTGENIIVTAKNPAFQNRIDNWQEKNEGVTPKLISFLDEGVKYFVNVEVYAD